jgi:hypothetical protein
MAVVERAWPLVGLDISQEQIVSMRNLYSFFRGDNGQVGNGHELEFDETYLPYQ